MNAQHFLECLHLIYPKVENWYTSTIIRYSRVALTPIFLKKKAFRSHLLEIRLKSFPFLEKRRETLLNQGFLVL